MKPTTGCSCSCGPTTRNPFVTTVKPVTTRQPITAVKPVTTIKPVTNVKPISTLKPATASSQKPMTTLRPATTKPGSTPTPAVATNYCAIKTCKVPTDNTLCKFSVFKSNMKINSAKHDLLLFNIKSLFGII